MDIKRIKLKNIIYNLCDETARKKIEELFERIESQISDAVWNEGLWTVQPWIDGNVYVKDGYSYCADFQLEPNTTYTMQISEDDGQTMYVGNLDNSVSQHGFYQTFTTDDTGVIPIWLISGRKEDAYKDGTIKACLIKGSVPIWQGENILKWVGDWAIRSSVKDTYPYNRFLDMYSPFGKYFSFNTGCYNEDITVGETWSGLTIGCPTNSKATEAGMRLEVPNGGVDFSFLNGMQGGTDVCLDFNMGIWGGATGAKYIFAFNESDIGTQYDRFVIEKGAIPMYLTKDGIMVKEDNTATVDATEGNWKTINLYNLESRTKALEEVAFASELGLSEVMEGEVFAVQKELTSRTLTHSWDFTSSLIDTVSSIEAVINNVATQNDNGIFIGYGNATDGYMKGHVFFENVFGRGKEIEIDVYSMIPSFDSSSHGRFIMFDSTSSNFDEGLIYRNTGAWSFYLNGGWSNEFSDLAKDCFSGKTVKIRVDEDGTTKLYADGALLGVCSLTMPETSVNVAIGSDARTYTGITISGVRIYDLI